MAGEKGCTWDTFERKARDNELLPSHVSSRHPISPTTGRLCREDMAIYGEVPVTDSLSLIVCQHCNRVFKSEAVAKHKECYHTELGQSPLMFPSAPLPPFFPHSIAQPSQAHSTDLSSSTTPSGPRPLHGGGDEEEKEEEEDGTMGFTASALPTIAPPMPVADTSGGRHNKEYDPDKHCGVWMPAERKHCTHSLLNCKLHHVAERREVKGRSASFEELAEEQKQQRKSKKLEKLWADAGLQQMSSSRSVGRASPSSSSPMNGPMSSGSGSGYSSSGRRHSAASPRPPRRRTQDTDQSSPCVEEEGRDKDHLSSFPKPLAACSLSCRCRSARGKLMFDRKSDNLRTLLARLTGQEGDYVTTTPHRKHSYNSLLESHKNRKRKYFSNQEQLSHLQSTSNAPASEGEGLVLRPTTLPVPLPLTPAPPLPSTPSHLIPHTPSHPMTPTGQPPPTPTQSLPRTPSQQVHSEHFFPTSHPVSPYPSELNIGMREGSINAAMLPLDPPMAGNIVDGNVAVHPSISSHPPVEQQSQQLATPNNVPEPGLIAGASDPAHMLGSMTGSAGLLASGSVGGASTTVPGQLHGRSLHDAHSLMNSTSDHQNIQQIQPPSYHDAQLQKQQQFQQLHQQQMVRLKEQQNKHQVNEQHQYQQLQQQRHLQQQHLLHQHQLQQQQQNQQLSQQKQLQQQQAQQHLIQQKQLQQQLEQQRQQQQQRTQFPVSVAPLGTASFDNTASDVTRTTESANRLPASMLEWDTGNLPGNRGRPREPLGINGELEDSGQDDRVGVSGERMHGDRHNLAAMPDGVGLARENLYATEDGLGRGGVDVGVKRKKPSSKKSNRSKRPRMDSHQPQPKSHRLSITEDSSNHSEGGPVPAGSTMSPYNREIPRSGSTEGSGQLYPVMSHAQLTSVSSSAEELRGSGVHPVMSLRPSGHQELPHVSMSGEFQPSNNGLPVSSHHDNLAPGGGGTLSYYQTATYHPPAEAVRPQHAGVAVQGGATIPTSLSLPETVRSRSGLVAPGRATTPPQVSAATAAVVATPLSQLVSSGQMASGGDSMRLAPEFGCIRVKVEPGLSDRESHSPPASRSLPNGLVSTQSSAPQLQALAVPSSVGGALRGVAAGDASAVLSPSHSFNSLHSPGQTLLLNPSASHGLSSLAQHQVGNLLGLSQLSYPQRLLAATPSVQQQFANLRQLEMYKLMLQQQQQQQARLLQPTIPAATSKATPSLTGGGGGVVNYQQVSTTVAALPRLQISVPSQLPTSINAHQQRLSMPTLTPAKVHAPVSHVPNAMAGFSRSDGLRALPTLTPANLSRTQNSLPSPLGPYHQNKSPTASNRPHLPSQQVT